MVTARFPLAGSPPHPSRLGPDAKAEAQAETCPVKQWVLNLG